MVSYSGYPKVELLGQQRLPTVPHSELPITVAAHPEKFPSIAQQNCVASSGCCRDESANACGLALYEKAYQLWSKLIRAVSMA